MGVETLDDVRKKHDLPTVVGRYVDHVKPKMVCPFPDHIHSNNTPSFSMYQVDGVQRFKCHGSCGHSGDVIDFIGYMEIPGYDKHNSAHVARAIELLNSETATIKPPITLPKEKPPLRQEAVKAMVLRWEMNLYNMPQALEYLYSRGITKEVMRRNKIGYRFYSPNELKEHKRGGHYISIPTFRGDYLVGVKFRRVETMHDGDTPLRYRSFSSKRYGKSGLGVFGYNGAKGYTGVIFSPEGEMDAMLIESLTPHRAVCMNAGANSISDDLLVVGGGIPVFLAEGDAPGRRHASEKRDLIGKGYIEHIPFGDVGEFYKEKGAHVVRRWLMHLAKQYAENNGTTGT